MCKVNKVILLPHPGGERLPRRNSTKVPWPTNRKHARKFIRAEGDWSLSNGCSGTSWLEFWTEYEGPTICDRLSLGEGMPRAVHCIDPKPAFPTMNTDPWVFLPGFVWSVCRHKAIRATHVLQGDLVLFGSTVRGEWLLDTVFVVEERVSGQQGTIGGVYDHLVLPAIDGQCQPFLGKAHATDAPCFSFVPAAISDIGHKPFCRPAISRHLRRLRKISDGVPPSPRNAQALTVCSAKEGVQRFWESLVHEVERLGLVLGVGMQHPSLPDSVQSTPSRPQDTAGMKCSGSTTSQSAKKCI